ncbi:MAG: YgjV family protein [Oleispira antarctica]|nr:YgjV family protein [Oleispira antarctica]MBQ0791953.1 YgjV family protein [Oleispira antarctica]
MELATLFGIFGVASNVIWPLLKTRKYLLLGQIVAAIFMGMHFLLLNAVTGASIMFLVALQASLAIPLESHPKFKAVYLTSIVLTPLVCWATWQGIASLFSSLALFFFCIGNLQLNIKRLRLLLLMCIFCWMGHNVFVASYAGLISNSLVLVTSIFALIREFKPEKSQAV